jgi:hypothetical protein
MIGLLNASDVGRNKKNNYKEEESHFSPRPLETDSLRKNFSFLRK